MNGEYELTEKGRKFIEESKKALTTEENAEFDNIIECVSKGGSITDHQQDRFDLLAKKMAEGVK